MTDERIEEIRKFTVNKAFKRLKYIDYSSPNVAFEVGAIFGELDKELYFQLRKEKTRSYVLTNNQKKFEREEIDNE